MLLSDGRLSRMIKQPFKRIKQKFRNLKYSFKNHYMDLTIMNQQSGRSEELQQKQVNRWRI